MSKEIEQQFTRLLNGERLKFEDFKSFVEENNMDLNLEYNNNTPLLYSALKLRSFAFTKYIVQHAPNSINHIDSAQNTALNYYAQYGDLKSAELLIKAGASPNVKNYFTLTAFEKACQSSNPKMVKVFLDNCKQLYLNEAVYFTLTGVHGSSNECTFKILRMLEKYSKQKKITKNIFTEKFVHEGLPNTPLHNVLRMTTDRPGAKKCRAELLEFFLKYEDINSEEAFGGNLLHFLCFEDEEDIETIKFVIDKGIDINKKDKMERTPLYYLMSNIKKATDENLELITMLLNSGAVIEMNRKTIYDSKTSDTFEALRANGVLSKNDKEIILNKLNEVKLEKTIGKISSEQENYVFSI